MKEIKSKFDLIYNQYYLFKDRIQKEIKTKQMTSSINNCYLLNDDWEEEFKDNLDNYKNIKNIIKDIVSYLKPKKELSIFNDISPVVNYLVQGYNIKLINKNLLESLYSKSILNNYNVVSYYAGYNKLIIEYKGQYINSNLLILNPFQMIYNNINSYIISFKTPENRKLELYETLLSKNIEFNKTIRNKLIDNNYVFTYGKNIINKHNFNYLFEEFNDDNKFNCQNSFNIEILKIFIYLYYFNKTLFIDNINDIFNESKYYFLINPDWLNKLKELYHYENIFYFLENYNINNNGINFDNLGGYEKAIINSYLKYDSKFTNLNNYENIINEININPKAVFKEKFYYFNNFFIIPDKIKEMIKECLYKYKSLEINPKKSFVKDNDIYLIDGVNINIIKFNEEFLFSPKYIFCYKSNIIMDHQQKNLKSYSIKEYIELNNCSEKDYNVQTLIKDNLVLGDFLILNHNNPEIISENDKEGNIIKKGKFISEDRILKNNEKFNDNNNYANKFINNKNGKINNKGDYLLNKNKDICNNSDINIIRNNLNLSNFNKANNNLKNLDDDSENEYNIKDDEEINNNIIKIKQDLPKQKNSFERINKKQNLESHKEKDDNINKRKNDLENKIVFQKYVNKNKL